MCLVTSLYSNQEMVELDKRYGLVGNTLVSGATSLKGLLVPQPFSLPLFGGLAKR